MKLDAVLGTVRSRLWRLGLVNNFNDPFDCLFALINRNITLSGEEYARYSAQFRKTHFSKYGVLCFSCLGTQPAMWAHYADRGKGACVECDVDDGANTYEMRYSDERLVLDVSDSVYLGSQECRDHVIEIIRRKHTSWSYEQERRFIVDLEHEKVLTRSPRKAAYGPDSFHCVPIEIARIRRIIVGPFADIGAEGLISNALLKAGFSGVTVVRAKVHHHEYLVSP